MVTLDPERVELSANRRAVLSFLNRQLKWLDKQCLSYSSLAATGDLWALGQYRYFKEYRKNVKHLIHLAETTGRKRKPLKPE